MADPLGSLVDVIAGLVDRPEASGFPYALGGAVASVPPKFKSQALLASPASVVEDQ